MSRVNNLIGAGLIAGALLMGSLGAAAEGDGRGQPNDHASCMAQERAPHTSAGGKWDHGTFGQNQSAFVIWLAQDTDTPFGVWLQTVFFAEICPTD